MSATTHSLRPVILVVEDSYLVARDLSEALEQAGYRVIGPAPSVAAAVACLETCRPDVAILDVDLDGTGSMAVAEYLKEQGIPFVVATGYAKEGLPRSFDSALYVGKPFPMEVLLALLHRLARMGRAVH